MRMLQNTTLFAAVLIGGPAAGGDCAGQASASSFLQCVKTEIAARSGGCGEKAAEERVAETEVSPKEPRAAPRPNDTRPCQGGINPAFSDGKKCGRRLVRSELWWAR